MPMQRKTYHPAFEYLWWITFLSISIYVVYRAILEGKKASETNLPWIYDESNNLLVLSEAFQGWPFSIREDISEYGASSLFNGRFWVHSGYPLNIIFKDNTDFMLSLKVDESGISLIDTKTQQSVATWVSAYNTLILGYPDIDDLQSQEDVGFNQGLRTVVGCMPLRKDDPRRLVNLLEIRSGCTVSSLGDDEVIIGSARHTESGERGKIIVIDGSSTLFFPESPGLPLLINQVGWDAVEAYSGTTQTIVGGSVFHLKTETVPPDILTELVVVVRKIDETMATCAGFASKSAATGKIYMPGTIPDDFFWDALRDINVADNLESYDYNWVIGECNPKYGRLIKEPDQQPYLFALGTCSPNMYQILCYPYSVAYHLI